MTIYVTGAALMKVWAYVDAVNTEIGGFGYAMKDEGHVIWLDTFLVPQEVSGGAVDMNADSMAAAIEKAVADNMLDDPNFLWVSWHSHNSMNAFWSGTDEECIRTYGSLGIPYLLSFVGNHRHEYSLRLDYFRVEHHGLVIPQVTQDKLKLMPDPQDDLFTTIQSDIEANVRQIKLAPAAKLGPKADKPWDLQARNDKTKGTDDRPGVHQHDLETSGMTLEQALEIRELMQFGVPRNEAEDIVLDGVDYQISARELTVESDPYEALMVGDTVAEMD